MSLRPSSSTLSSMAVAFVLCALAAEGAKAQVTIANHALNPVRFDRADCESDDEARLDVDITGLNNQLFRWTERVMLRGRASQGVVSCPDLFVEDTLSTVFATADLQPNTGTNRFLEVYDLSVTELFGEDACAGDGVRETNAALCLYVLERDVNRVVASDGIAVSYDTELPAPPAISGVREGDGRVSFTVEADTSAGDTYDALVQYRACTPLDAGPAADAGGTGDADGGAPDGGPGLIEDDESLCDSPNDYTEVDFDDLDVVLGSLENNVEYEIRARLRDDFGNVGEESEAFLATPRPQLGPLDLYNGAGSPYSFTPSCSAAGGSAFAFGGLALGLLLLVRRRRGRRRAGQGGAMLGALVVATSLASPGARADFGDLSLGIHVGPYAPGIDSERVDGEPIFPIYDCFFDDQLMPELGFQVGLELFDGFGSLEVGLHSSFSQARGKSQPLSAVDPETGLATCGRPTDESVELTIVKLRPAVTYRFDPLLDWYGIPLVPYGRAGLVAAGYGFTSGGLFDETAGEGARDPLGVVFGYEGAVGMQLALGFLDHIDPFTPRTATRARANNVFEHAFIFGELLYQDISNFGQPGFVFSPQDRLFGTDLPITAHFGIALELP